MSNDDPDSKTNPDQGCPQPSISAVEDIADDPRSKYSSPEYHSRNHV